MIRYKNQNLEETNIIKVTNPMWINDLMKNRLALDIPDTQCQVLDDIFAEKGGDVVQIP